MREMYVSADDDGQAPVVIVAHDWGALVGFRLATEAPVLADRFILSNSVHVRSYITVHLSYINVLLCLASASTSKYPESSCRHWADA